MVIGTSIIPVFSDAQRLILITVIVHRSCPFNEAENTQTDLVEAWKNRDKLAIRTYLNPVLQTASRYYIFELCVPVTAVMFGSCTLWSLS